jgi:hypothetical protein
MSRLKMPLVRKNKGGELPSLAPAGELNLRELFEQAAWVMVPFVWVLLMKIQSYRFHYSTVSAVLMWAVVIAIVAFPLLAFYVYIVGIWRTISSSVARASAVVFWLYWPCVRLICIIVSVALACVYGDYLWYNYFQLYEEYYRLQAYDNVDAHLVTGTRLQDAGLVAFNTQASNISLISGVDRSKAGCIVNGHTYCVAPIVAGGVVKPGVAQTKSGVQDLFMAGIDCCNCPVTDFRCGDWGDSSGKLGGMRLFNEENSRMFTLAAEKWAANYGKVMSHGVFFEWANEPIVAWKKLWRHGFHLAVMYCIFGVLGSFLLMLILNGFMRLMREFRIAAPIDESPPKLPGLTSQNDLARDFIPGEFRSYMNQREYEPQDDKRFMIL